jgi:hypothetical protein
MYMHMWWGGRTGCPQLSSLPRSARGGARRRCARLSRKVMLVGRRPGLTVGVDGTSSTIWIGESSMCGCRPIT